MARPKKIVSNTDLPIQQKSSILLPDEGEIDHANVIEVAQESAVYDQHTKDLQFNEEPVTILIAESHEEFAPRVIDNVVVNGKGAEQYVNGKWMICGWLPVATPVTTRRKYVEVLLRTKRDKVTTEHESNNVEKPRNWAHRRTTSAISLSVLRDDNPAGQDWLRKVTYEQ